MKLPDFAFECKALDRGYKCIAGVDEVGRGSLAGPVVAACVTFNLDFIRNIESVKTLIKDSKKMSSKQREKANEWIQTNCLSFGVGEASVAQIDKFGIKKATDIAFRKAIKNCRQNCKIDYLLSDAFYIPGIKSLSRECQLPIIKGDNISVSIAAASIVAKVYRDELLINLGKRGKYRHYCWDKNKGYGTLAHREAILKNGITEHHRTLFVQKVLTNQSTI